MRAAALLLGIAICGPAAGACSIAEVSLSHVSVTPDVPPYTRVSGMITNLCPDAVGVQIEIVLRSQDGQVIGARKPWPFGVRNMRGSEAFSTLIDGRGQVSVRVINIHRW